MMSLNHFYEAPKFQTPKETSKISDILEAFCIFIHQFPFFPKTTNEKRNFDFHPFETGLLFFEK